MRDKVEKILNDKVKPILANHKGDIDLVAVEDNCVEVSLLGACSGCPSAKNTLEEVVLANIQEELPQIQEVRLVTVISPDILSLAKNILNSSRRV